jgi:beta-glucanase (GH16 family)
MKKFYLLTNLFLVLIMVQACNSTQPQTAISLPGKGKWQLIFQDEFDHQNLDQTKWNTCYPWVENGGCTNSGNSELEWYQPDEVFIENGVLKLQAQKRSMNGFPYTAGMISSHGKFEFQYGYIEARLKVPAGKGLWPALWLLPANLEWPPEIDIHEILGHTTSTVHMTLHYKQPGAPHLSSGGSYIGPDFSADFHTIAVLWEPQTIIWYVDGIERYYVENDIPAQPMYVIANLAVGGNWPGSPDENTPFPSTYDIDYIRVWQNQSFFTTQSLPTMTPSGGKHILHAEKLEVVNADGTQMKSFSPGIIYFHVQVTNQDQQPIRGVNVTLSILDSNKEEYTPAFSLEKTDRFGWATCVATIPKGKEGTYYVEVKKTTLTSDPNATYSPEKNVKPIKFVVK